MALCRITHTFMDASGNPVPGVVVRFTPLPVQDAGLVAREVTVVSSNAEGTLGEIDFSLIQGLRGTLSMTHVPLVREVTIPFTDAAGLLDLVANTPDPLEPIDRGFIDLPRSS